MQPPMPNHVIDSAEVVICGAGIIGCATAFHLTQMGCRSVLVLEQGPSLACGSTWLSSPVIGQVRQSLMLSRLTQLTLQSCRSLEEMGFATGVSECGSLSFAEDEQAAEALRRGKALADWLGVKAQLLSPSEAQQLLPADLLNPEGLQAALHVPSDAASCDATQLAAAYLSAAESNGASVRYRTRARRLRVDAGGRISGVVTTDGIVECGRLLLAAGQWTRQLGRQSPEPIRVPLQSCQRLSLVTEDDKRVSPDCPSLTFAASGLQARSLTPGGLCISGVSPEGGRVVFPTGVPVGFANQLLPNDEEQFQLLADAAQQRMPLLGQMQIKSRVTSPESFTPDGLPIFGEATGMAGCYVAAGMNSIGFSLSGGIGQSMAELMLNGRPKIDTTHMDMSRFVQQHTDHPAFLLDRAPEVAAAWTRVGPKTTYNTGRKLIVSALHENQRELGAVFEQTPNGYESPAMFDPSFTDAEFTKSFQSFSRPNWLPNVMAEWRKMQRIKTIHNQSSATQIRITAQLVDDLEGFLSSVFVRKRQQSGLQSLDSVNEATIFSSCGQFVEVVGKLVKQTQHSAIFIAPSSQQTKVVELLKERVLDEAVSITDITINYCLLHLPRAVNFGDLPRLPEEAFCFANENDIYVLAQTGNANRIYRFLNQIQGFAPIGHYAARMWRLVEGRPQLGEDFSGRYSRQQLEEVRKYTIESLNVTSDPWAWGGEPVFFSDDNQPATTLMCCSLDPNLNKLVTFCTIPEAESQRQLCVRVGSSTHQLVPM